jgi:hypothetical protein
MLHIDDDATDTMRDAWRKQGKARQLSEALSRYQFCQQQRAEASRNGWLTVDDWSAKTYVSLHMYPEVLKRLER